jgi:hypothetical protein
VTISNGMNATATDGTVMGAENLPSALTLVSMAGMGWTCGAKVCTRSDALNGGASYPAITVLANVALNASSPEGNQVSVLGMGHQRRTRAIPTVK